MVIDDPIDGRVDEPAELQRATQAIADALERTIARGAGPVVQLQADVARDGRREAARARARGPCIAETDQAGARDGGSGRHRGARAGRRTPDRQSRPCASAGSAADDHPAGSRPARSAGSSWLLCRLPERPLIALAEIGGRRRATGAARTSGPGAAQPRAGRRLARRARAAVRRQARPRRPTRGRSSGSSAPRSATTRATTSR